MIFKLILLLSFIFNVHLQPDSCDKTQVFKNCMNACPVTCQIDQSTCQEFPTNNKNCTQGCDCKPGYFLDTISKECLTKTQCKQAAKCNLIAGKQVYSPCLGDPNCQNTCQNSFLSKQCDTSKCTPGCVCQSGYTRDKMNGKCVICEESNCDPKTQEWINYDECSRCQSTCQNPMSPYDCEQTNSSPCQNVCVCKEGFIYDEVSQTCIEEQKCLDILNGSYECNSTTETLSLCDANCELTCQDATDQCDNTNCQTGCVCRDDYIRDNVTNTCINPDNCPNPLCNDLTSQKWTRCALNCGRPTCQNSNPVQCESTYCDPGCVCRDGYKQDESHDDYSYNETTGVSSYSIQCLTDQMCENVLFNSADCNNETEYWVKSQYCDESCHSSYECNITEEVPGCICRPGRARNSKNECILKDDCISDCDPNTETYAYTDVNSRTCLYPYNRIFFPLLGPVLPLIGIPFFQQKCICKQGLLLDDDTHKCVKPSDCKMLGGCDPDMNQIFVSCPQQCETYCDQVDSTGVSIKSCPPFDPFSTSPPGCYSDCVCSPGFARNFDNNCVRISECPVQKNCTIPNQIYVNCSSECYPTISKPVIDYNCFSDESGNECENGCVCKEARTVEDNLYDWNNCVQQSSQNLGPFVPIDDFDRQLCSNLFCDTSANETWNFGNFNTCVKGCPGSGFKATCYKEQCNFCSCISGYVRDANKRCINVFDCPIFKGIQG